VRLRDRRGAKSVKLDCRLILNADNRGIVLVRAVEIFDLDAVERIGRRGAGDVNRIVAVREKVVVGQIVSRGDVRRISDAVAGDRSVAVGDELEDAFAPHQRGIGGVGQCLEVIGGGALLDIGGREEQPGGGAVAAEVCQRAEQGRVEPRAELRAGKKRRHDILRVGIDDAATEDRQPLHLKAVVRYAGVGAEIIRRCRKVRGR
jgi:hypothetical protein